MSEYAHAPDPTTIRLERRLPGPIERVWAYLVEGEKRALWFAGGEFELRPGGKATLVFNHSKLSSEPTPEAWKPYEGMVATGEVTRVEPPRLLAYKWTEGDLTTEVTFELTPQGQEVVLVLTQTKLADAKAKANYSSGWHAHLGVLEDRLRGVPPRPFWTYFNKLESEYAGRF